MARERTTEEATLDRTLRARTASGVLCEKLEGGSVRCHACAHRCVILDGHDGICKVRFNQGGELRVPRGYVAGLQVDPIEKKPFYHAFPGAEALSFGMLGCDFHCDYCQNWLSSQVLRDSEAGSAPRDISAADLVALGKRRRAPVAVSTYNEPLITTEWAVEVFQEARRAGMTCGYVSNGHATPEVLRYLRPHADLYKVDLKSFQDKAYRSLGGRLAPVLESIRMLRELGFWVEVVTLVVPGFNDSEAELRDMARFLAGVSPDLPWHCTAFHADYRMTEPPRTTVRQLIRACELGREEGLRYCYAGNLPGYVGDWEHTCCPRCSRQLVRRHGFQVLSCELEGGRCPGCREPIAGFWSSDCRVPAAAGKGAMTQPPSAGT